ncbi:DUF2968 domain-containing protein [Roseateles amylovorans]|uniref:DUF2968 domain-containing protein n=1 Tax=Roseateles amylovorans TaxID=2978473 RepID=A0ABY6B472_9BURK|nr:DUF2968 domain-containing protein [Roseateles amylovorans]UXH79989.1 DUF2968 domain-containing protein [Roseateles amylovorans]
MHPPRRLDRLSACMPAWRGTVLAMLAAVWVASGPAVAAQAPPNGKTGQAAGATKGRKPAPSTANHPEAADIAELRARIANREVSLLRRTEVSDAAIEVWLHPPSRQYYVGVSMQGTLRRTLKSTNEAEAWLGFDSFRRLAAIGDVGRPVLLGQMAGGSGASSSASTTTARSLPAPPHPPAVMPGQDLRTVAVPPEQIAAPPAVDAADLALVEQARNNVDPNRRTSTVAVPAEPAENARPAGQAVETLRRQRLGDDVARLVWSADTAQYSASLTRQGKVVGMLRTGDGALAARAYEDFLRQAEARAAVMPAAEAASAARPAASASLRPTSLRIDSDPAAPHAVTAKPLKTAKVGRTARPRQVAGGLSTAQTPKAARTSKAHSARTAAAKGDKTDKASRASKTAKARATKASAPQPPPAPPAT